MEYGGMEMEDDLHSLTTYELMRCLRERDDNFLGLKSVYNIEEWHLHLDVNISTIRHIFKRSF
jgi:hypothetical protein